VRLLIIDADPAVASACERIFEGEHEVVQLDSGLVALELLAIGRAFDVILCDLDLPDLKGADLHARLVASAPRVAPKIVFMGDDPTPHQSFLDSLPNMFAKKPLGPRELRQLVRDAAMR
jgi:CheY-like chemotaxis protein